ncbi:hypothetical protein CUR95_24205 [Bordetella bronchiseptica]|nr:hypothetical protein [Bordetella bronchiseptica]
MTTQPVLTDDQIRTIITDAHQSHGAFKTGYGLSLGRAIETAVLSKLRAPVADELPHWEEISAKLERDETLTPLEFFIYENEPASAGAWRDQLAAALASAPVADRQRLRELVDVVWNEATESTAVPDTPWADRMIDRVFPAGSASAPVAGEAVAGYMVGTDYFRPHALTGARKYAENRNMTVRILRYADAAPQASAEDVRNAALEEAAAAMDDHCRAGREWIPGSLWDALSREAGARIRALKSTPAPRAAEDSEDDMLTIAYLAGAQAEKERAALSAQPGAIRNPLIAEPSGNPGELDCAALPAQAGAKKTGGSDE